MGYFAFFFQIAESQLFRIDGMNVIFTWETVVVVCVGEGGGANYHYLRPRA